MLYFVLSFTGFNSELLTGSTALEAKSYRKGRVFAFAQGIGYLYIHTEAHIQIRQPWFTYNPVQEGITAIDTCTFEAVCWCHCSQSQSITYIEAPR